MNKVIHSVKDIVANELGKDVYDVVEMIPIPSTGDRMVKIRTLTEILEEFDETDGDQVLDYLVRVRSGSSKGEAQSLPSIQKKFDEIYLSDGRLNVPYLKKNAQILFNAKEYALAKNIYKILISSGEKNADLYYGMAVCCELEGEMESAKFHYQESLVFDPQFETYQRLISLLMKEKNDLATVEMINRALYLENLPGKIKFECHKTCANCLVRLEKYDEAEKHYRFALQVDPAADDIQYGLGALYLRMKNFEKAKRCFQDTIASNPRNHEAFSGLGSCLMEERDILAAHDSFANALKIDLKNPNAIFYLVKTAYQLKKYDVAEQIVSDYIQIAPINPNLLFSLAGLQYHTGKNAKAKKTVQKLLEIKPDHGGGRHLLKLVGS